jgi:hypothetical protein
MIKELAEAIRDALEWDSLEAYVDEGYSGRGMYGAKTHAVVTDATFGQIVQAITGNAFLFVREEGGMITQDQTIRHDSMGKGLVLY